MATRDAPAPVRSPTLLAGFWMVGTVLSFTSMAVAGRELSAGLDTFEIMLYRSLVGVGIVLAVGAAAGTLSQVSVLRFRLHVIRNVTHFTAQNLWFYAIATIPLAQVVALEFTSPLWVVLLAPLVLGERLTPVRALAALLGFVGILIVARPGVTPLEAGQVTAAGAALGFALTALATRALTRTESITCIMFWLTLMQAVLGLAAAGVDGDIALPGPGALPFVALVGVAGLSAHFCLTNALRLAPAGVVMPMDFARLPVIAFVGMALYAEPLEWAVLVGALVIFAANWINIRAQTRETTQALRPE